MVAQRCRTGVGRHDAPHPQARTDAVPVAHQRIQLASYAPDRRQCHSRRHARARRRRVNARTSLAQSMASVTVGDAVGRGLVTVCLRGTSREIPYPVRGAPVRVIAPVWDGREFNRSFNPYWKPPCAAKLRHPIAHAQNPSADLARPGGFRASSRYPHTRRPQLLRRQRRPASHCAHERGAVPHRQGILRQRLSRPSKEDWRVHAECYLARGCDILRGQLRFGR